MRRSSKLHFALRKGLLVKFLRPFEPGSFIGYVLEIGPRFLLLALVEDGCRFNGFSCVRLSDVRKLEAPHKYAGFVEAALKKTGQRPPRKSRITVANIEGLLLSASRVYPLVTIHREIINADICHIGHVAGVKDGMVSVLEIGPDAKWQDTPTAYRFKDITRVDFGGGYENALSLVGGAPPNTPLQPTAEKRRRLKRKIVNRPLA